MIIGRKQEQQELLAAANAEYSLKSNIFGGKT